MSNIIGPVRATARARLADWYTMRELREDVRFFRERNRAATADHQFRTYKHFLSNYASGKIT